MNKELKQLEDTFKKRIVQYEKVYQTAMSNMSACRKHGISNDEFIQVSIKHRGAVITSNNAHNLSIILLTLLMSHCNMY
jgi:hypothetical protein